MMQPDSHPAPASVVLASSLVSDEDLDGWVDELMEGGAQRRTVMERGGADVLTTGVKEVDEVLCGGVKAGRMVGLSGEAAGLSLHFLTSFLLVSHTSYAAIIDTAGNLDVLRIYSLLIARFTRDPHLLKSRQGTTESPVLGAEEMAAKLLERVKIMRVFDFEGVMEAMEEIREGLGEKAEGMNAEEEAKGIEKERDVQQQTEPEPVSRRMVIADSEDEDDDDEMLFDASATNPPLIPVLDGQTDLEQSEAPERREEAVVEGKVSFIIIDNLAHVLNPLLKKDYVQAMVQSTALLRTLATLTHIHTLHTVCLNPAPLLPSYPSDLLSKPVAENENPNTYVPAAPQQENSKPHPPKLPSIFSSTSNVPAIAYILPRYLDLHLLVEKLPRRKMDAKLVCSDDGIGGLGKRIGYGRMRKEGEVASVVEILSDRWGNGTGSWGILEEGG